MKILQINCVYNYGSTGKIVHDIHTELQKRNIESVVCYGRGKKINEFNIYKTCGELYSKFNNLLTRVTGIMYGGCFFSTRNLINIIEKEKPDIVHLHCINGYFVNIYKLINYLKTNNIKTILTLHAEFMYTANCGYALDCNKWLTGCGNCPRLRKETKSLFFDRTAKSWQLMKKSFNGFERLIIVGCSNWIVNKAKSSPFFLNSNVITINNGIDIDSFDLKKNQVYESKLREKYKIQRNKHIILHVTPSFYNENKGGKYFLKISQLLSDKYQCIVIGSTIKERDNIISIPFIKDKKELAIFYKMADVLVITSKIENYPTVCLEANCCGTPVVGFAVGGVKETIFNGMGKTVEYGNINELIKEIEFFSMEKHNISIKTIIDCRNKNDIKRMMKDYINLYYSLINSSEN